MRFGYAAKAFNTLPAASTRSGDLLKAYSTTQGGTAQVYWVRSNGTAWVSMGGPIFQGTWANKPTPSDCPVRSQIIVSDMGNSTFITNGTAWVPFNGRSVFYNPTQVTMTDATGTTDTVVLSFQLPAAVLAINSMIALEWSLTKSSAQACTGTMRLGSAGTTSDVAIASYSLATTSSSFGRMERYLIESATTVRRLGSGNANDDDNYDGAASNQAGTVTIPNISGSLYLTASLAWTLAATAGDNVKIRQFTAEIISKV